VKRKSSVCVRKKNVKKFEQLREETKVALKFQYTGGREGKMSA
jgi:hypothetical protein